MVKVVYRQPQNIFLEFNCCSKLVAHVCVCVCGGAPRHVHGEGGFFFPSKSAGMWSIVLGQDLGCFCCVVWTILPINYWKIGTYRSEILYLKFHLSVVVRWKFAGISGDFSMLQEPRLVTDECMAVSAEHIALGLFDLFTASVKAPLASMVRVINICPNMFPDSDFFSDVSLL